MAEIEYGGIKASGSKLLLVIPLLGTIGGGLWGGFEFYKDYINMKEQIQSYTAPDLSGFDKKLAILQEEMVATKTVVNAFKDEIIIIRDSIVDTQDNFRDTKHDLRGEIVRTEGLLEKVEADINEVEDEARALLDEGEKEQDKLKGDVRAMIDDANNRFNDKVSGLEGYVKRELTSLEDRLNNKLMKALDNPLANR
jgi:chromosome segregation ATPase